MTAQQRIDPITLGSLAREALISFDGDTEKAVDSIVKKLMRDTVLLRSLIRGAIHDAVAYRTEMAMRAKRRSIIGATTGDRGAVVALASGWTAALLDMPLSNGVRLRDATREQVVEQANRYSATATDAARKAKWLTLIAQSVPAGKRVGDVMDDERAAELYQEAA